MIKNFLLLLVTILAFTFSVTANDCFYWFAKVDTKTEVNYELNEKDPQNIIKAIDCLLKLEGNRSKGLFSGATNNRVSQTFPFATVEVCALFYISYLFYDDWEHTDGISLVDKNGKLNSNGTVKKAFSLYRKWFKKVQIIGLVEARKQKLNPLTNSGIRWY